METTDLQACRIEEAGIWTWSIESDLVFADTAVAKLFGIDQEETLHGLPVERFLTRIHVSDRPRIARKLSQAIIGGQPYREEYRVEDYRGTIRWVMAHGRCFRDRSGNPVQYAGIVHPIEYPPNLKVTT
ncbi:hypothetical protein A6U86_13420 [Rhizobium sp. AC27/96]|uniref:PAS domain-containing protein n=1 Tax=Rhizobium sp. AC27/96 TaxID=1841653 RepID=UPI0008294487|nr:PAS domain-containing protein [Rhizobium sp. AC27/96]OCJ00580.1 hypothetical protein A6U86_13420 [Rhizobium sp. AC27/96]